MRATPRFLARRPARTTRRSFGPAGWSAGTFRSTPFLHGYQPPSTITGCQAEPWFDTWVPLLLSLSVVAPRSLALGRLLYVLIIPVHGNHLPPSIQWRVPSVLRGSESRRHSPGPFTLAASCEALFVPTHEVPSVHGENVRAPPFSIRRPREANSYLLYTSV